MRRIVTPGASIGTRIIDCWVWRGPAGSVLPIKIAIRQRGSPAPEIHHLRPLMTYSSPSRTMRAWMLVDLDRKSTRLNSSHQIISYAVFCLKKKKQYTDCRQDINTNPNDHRHE